MHSSVASLRASLFGKRGQGRDKPKAAAGNSSWGSPAGSGGPRLSGEAGPKSGPLVWAEVYCGSAEAGKWVHVDVINGVMNK